MKRASQSGRTESSVTIVGPGRVGQALGKLLAEAGVPVRTVAARNLAKSRHAARFIGAGRAVGLNAAELSEAAVVLLTVSDAAIFPVAKNLSTIRDDWSGKCVLHTCGAMSSSVLEPLRRRGAAIASMHPFQTVPSREAGVRNLKGCFWGIEGDEAACKLATRWIKRLHGTPVPVRRDRKLLYHVAAFLSCPTVVTLMDSSVRLLRLSGVPDRLTRPMLINCVGEVIGNYLRYGARGALTGPQMRDDWDTIQKHMNALGRFSPDLLPVYRELLRGILRLARREAPRGLLEEHG